MDESDVLIPRVVKTRRFRPDDDHRFSRSIIDRCFNTLEAYISDSASKSNTLADSIKINFIESVMCVPLLGSDGKAIGALQLDARDSSKRFREDDLKLLMIVANLCGLAIERANLYELKSQKEKQDYELRLARKIQLSFLPESTPVIPGYEFYSYYLAAQSIGGDYYDFIELPDGRVAVVVGDVAGKGVPAALLMAKLSSEARNCFQSTPNIERAIYVLNNRLTHVIGDRFVTLLAMVIDPNRHKATIVSAAHELFVLRDNKFCDVDCLTIRGLPLGTAPEIEYQSREIDLNIGETFLLFTDGLTDTPKEDKLLTLGLAKAISPLAVQGLMTTPKIVGERIIDIVTAHMNGREQADDIALICFGRPHPSVV